MPHQNNTNTGNPPAALILAISKLLKPLVRLLLSFRIAFPQLAELLKSTYVEVAEKEFTLEDKPQTDTRLSLLTGIHRKDIKRLRNQITETAAAPAVISTGGRLVARWVSEEKYRDSNNAPLPLPLKGKQDEPSFESLVQDVFKQDIRPRVILDEWLNLGVVSMSRDKIITLNTQAFIPSKGLDEKAFFLGHNLADHFAASTHNLLDQQPAFFERCIYYDGLSDESIEALRELVANRGMETLMALNELAMSLKTKDMAKVENKQRLNIGLYVYHEAEESEK
ncbi:MAG: DUF6502 family protein [Leucothrix sp.]